MVSQLRANAPALAHLGGTAPGVKCAASDAFGRRARAAKRPLVAVLVGAVPACKCANVGAFGVAKRPLTAVLILLLVALLAGCAGPEARYVSVPLDCPARPELPTVSAEELDCLPPEAHARLVWRDTLRRQYAEELEALCWSTHEGANAPLTAHLKGAK